MKRVNRDSQSLRVSNPQGYAAMRIAFERVRDGSFDEYDIRFLLSGIRPIARETFYRLKSKQGASQELIDRWAMLMDVCDVVAHPEYKDQGALQRLIVATEEWLRNHFMHLSSAQEFSAEAEKILSFELPQGIPISKSHTLVSDFFVALEQYLGCDIELERIITQRFNEVLLCLFTILHYTQVLVESSKKEAQRGGAILMCGSQGKFGLYAAVEKTRIMERVSSSLPSDRPHTFPIPLFSGVAATVDNSRAMGFSNPCVGLALRHRDGHLGLFVRTLEELGLHKWDRDSVPDQA